MEHRDSCCNIAILLIYPPSPRPVPTCAAPAAAALRPVTPPSERPAAASSVLLTSTPRSEARARRPISRTAPEAAVSPVPASVPAPSAAAATVEVAPPSSATRQSARIASKLRELGIDPAAGGDTLKEPNGDDEPLKKAANTASWGRVLLSPAVFLLALIPLYLLSACNKKHCSIGRLPDLPRALKSWLDPVAFLYVFGLLAVHLLLALLPVGRVVEGQISKQGLLRYRCGGFVSLTLTLSGALLAFYLGFPVLAVLLKLRLLLVSATLTSVLLALALHLRSRRAHLLDINQAGDTDSLLVNLVEGRELSPRLLGVDLKLLVVRSCCVATALLAVLMALAERASHGQSSPTLVTVAAMVVVLCLDRMWFEDNLLTTYSFMNEGLGLRQLLVLLTAPFYMTFNLRFIMVTGVSQPWYGLLGSGVLFMVGYLIQRSSDSQKNEFRKNPVNPALAHLETIPTTKGKKLLVSGWWGVVRHPNRLGGLIIVTAMCLPLGFQHGLAWLMPLFAVVTATLQTRKLDAHCQRKYGAAWDRYVDRVRHRLVPGVY
ncbi:delta(14)-sterol reductase TM7SF2-like [Pollicipes pollicipes]|uniref:delta(14)-sterol reductase TM7SF2-like n=1 Tax=Pollicipes pollicipes TaxID=41117 RepID=UPI0018851322|nr:delta(14)-sterol reductase TM7SF2-like [Pollicipes pollicipes]